MIGSGMVIEPLINLAKGKPAYEDDETWFSAVAKGILMSGILGPNLRWLQIANGAFGGGFLPTTSKYKDRGLESLGGAGLGTLADIGRGVGAAVRGDTTETQARKNFKSIPFVSSWWSAPVLNQFVDWLEFPKTKKQTTPWAYRDLLNGE